MKKATLTEKKVEQTPSGGALVGKRQGQTIIHNKGTLSGYLVGKTHAEGGIKAVNKSTGQPLEMQGGEVVITAPAVSDTTKRNFDGKMMTNREILSTINERGGGVAFAEKGMEIPKNIKRTGASYNYGGKTMTDHEIYKYITGGGIAEGYSLREIANIHQVPLSELKEQVRMGMKSESEHTPSKREQMKIVKDHLFENPKYYTVLKKAGLKHGGRVHRDSLVRDAKRGNTPARDLNNYNDVLDIDADGIVGAETGLYANGGMMTNGGLIAPNGKPSGLYFSEIYNLVRTPEFKAWFGDWEEAYITKNYDGVSKIIDENGEPLICVHNSPNEFFEFDEYKIGSTTDAGYYGKGFYFFPNVGFDKYGKIEYNCFLNIKNPYFKQSSHRNYELKSEELKNEGFDGVIVYPNFYKDFNFENGVDNAEEIVAYYSEQIKLADGSNTTFDSNNPDIRFELGGIYHGSPYSFDRFTTKKIGSGEGAQAFGWGLYFTDLEGIARSYAKPSIDNEFVLNGVNLRGKIPYNLLIDLNTLIQFRDKPELFYGEAKNFEKRTIEALRKYAVESNNEELYNAFRYIDSFNDLKFNRNLYKVSLHKGKTPDQYTWLEWDKRININNLIKIFEGSEKIGGIDFKDGWELDNRGILTNKSGYEVKGDEMYDWLSKKLGSPKMASLFLLENGIDGIKYPAESIAKGTTSETARGFNYVVFDENAVTIEEKQNFNQGGAVGKETVLFAVRKGEPDYNEVLITNNPDRIEDAKKWALANGFDRLRVSTIDMREKPDFRKTFMEGGKMENGGYLDNLSEKSKETIDSNYNREFGIYDFDFNKESKRENYFEWLTKFKNEQFKKNLKKGINAVSEDIDLLEKRKESDKKLKDFEELILPTLGNDVKNPSLSEYQEMVLMNPYVTEEELREALSDTSIFDKEGSIDKAKITESEFFNEDGINLPNFERFVEKNPEYKGVFDHWKKMLDENMKLHIKETNAFRYPTIADLKELKEELLNLDKNNFATGGSIKPYDANMEGDSADMMFDDGGQVISSEVYDWDKVPSNYRNISKVKKVPFTNNPMDKGLDSIVSPFLSKDEARPSMTGINFDDNGITATNAHILITLPYPNKKYDGIYDINKVKKTKSNELLLIDENYAKYENVIPKYKDAGVPYLVSVYKLLQYTKSAINYANKITYAIAYKFGDNDIIGFNGKFLVDVLTAVLKLGHEKIYVFISRNNRAILLSPNKEYELGSDEILLTMPVMINSQYNTINGYGTQDLDYNRSLKAYYDFNDDEIHNADGSVAEFKMEYQKNVLVDEKYLALLSKITSKKNKIPILDYAKVENGMMTATDLDISLIIKDVNMPNGIYEIYKNAPNITMQPLEDFPRKSVFNKDEYETHWKTDKRLTAFEFVTFSEVFEFYLDKLLLSVGKDDLRPVMSGICIKKTNDNNLFLVTTDAHTMCKINITEYCEFEKDDRNLEYILPVKYLKDFVKLADGSLHFKCNLTNIFVEAENLEYVARAIDGKYPNYEAVIPKENDKMMVFNHVQMNNCLKSKEYLNLLAKYKGQKNVYFNLMNSGDKLYVRVNESMGYKVQDKMLEEVELCNINFNFTKTDKTFTIYDSLFLLMPTMDTAMQNQYFAFRKDFFNVMLETITDTEVECYFTEPNRAYLFPIDAIDYKKTLPDEKTKQQHKKVAKAKKEAVNVDKEQIREAIETLLMLAEMEQNEEQRKEIYEALEILNMLKEDSYEYGGTLSKKINFEPIRTPLN